MSADAAGNGLVARLLGRRPGAKPNGLKLPADQPAAAAVSLRPGRLPAGFVRLGPLLAIALLWLLALVASLVLTPPRYIVGGLFALPILVAAHRLPPRGVAVISAVSIVLDILSGWLDQPPPSAFAFNLIALLVVGYLAMRLASEQDESRRQAHEAEDARQRLEQFMGMVSHDMRGPLFTVLARAQMLAEDAGDPASLRVIESATMRIRRFADDMIDAARIGSGRFTIDAQLMDLVPALRDLVAGLEEGDQRRLVLESPPEVTGCWDRDRIGQLFANLISNALKYSPAGSPVRLGVEHTEAEALVSVTDQGCGISREQMRLLFQPFARFPAGSRAAHGTGLGLYIAKAIAEAQGGRIWLDSIPGQGTTFYVALSRAC